MPPSDLVSLSYWACLHGLALPSVISMSNEIALVANKGILIGQKNGNWWNLAIKSRKVGHKDQSETDTQRGTKEALLANRGTCIFLFKME